MVEKSAIFNLSLLCKIKILKIWQPNTTINLKSSKNKGNNIFKTCNLIIKEKLKQYNKN